MINVAITYNAVVGGVSVHSLKKAFTSIGCNVVDADYRICSCKIPNEDFDNFQKQEMIWSHLKFEAAKMLKDMHCLVLSGSNTMIDPHLFNRERERDKKYDFQRAMSELALIHIAINRGMPILSTCFGHQLVAVYFGGTLKNLSLHELRQQNFHGDDVIRFQSGCVLSKIVNQTEQTFFGSHRQAVDELGQGLKACGIASDGHSNEAFESEFHFCVLGTQFHPEVSLHGLMNNTNAYQGNFSSQKSSLNIFLFMKDAANTFKNHSSLINELKLLNQKKKKVVLENDSNQFWMKVMKIILYIFFPWFVFIKKLRIRYTQFVKNLENKNSFIHQSPFHCLNNSPARKVS